MQRRPSAAWEQVRGAAGAGGVHHSRRHGGTVARLRAAGTVAGLRVAGTAAGGTGRTVARRLGHGGTERQAPLPSSSSWLLTLAGHCRPSSWLARFWPRPASSCLPLLLPPPVCRDTVVLRRVTRNKQLEISRHEPGIPAAPRLAGQQLRTVQDAAPHRGGSLLPARRRRLPCTRVRRDCRRRRLPAPAPLLPQRPRRAHRACVAPADDDRPR